MRLAILETTGEFDIAGYAALESVPYDRPALTDLDSSFVQGQIALNRLSILIQEVDEGLVSDEAFEEAWKKAEGETVLERAQMAVLIALEGDEGEEKSKKTRAAKAPKETAPIVATE